MPNQTPTKASISKQIISGLWLVCFLLLSSCQSPRLTRGEMTVSLTAAGETKDVRVPAGSTVEDALKAAGYEPGNLDKVTPSLFTVLKEGDQIEYVQVKENFETEDQVVPYERQVVRNESLPEGETRLIQSGSNGSQELTYRIVFEDDQEVSRSVVKIVTLKEPTPEIVMVGAQSSFAPLPIPGVLTYLAGGNAWLMEGSTANRRIVVSTGDLDGRVFALSPKGDWLLFTRKSSQTPDKEINTLWVVNLASSNPKPLDLKTSNVVHFADFVPGKISTIVYSTVEPRAQAPGWQANNDLYSLVFNASRAVNRGKVIESSSGGVYGWWGTEYVWSPNGQLAYARPDGIGLVDVDKGYLKPLLDITPLQTHSDWAWIPGLVWGADDRTLFFVSHAPPPNLVNPEESPYFDLSARSLANNATVDVVQQAGMFAYPSASALRPSGREKTYQMAYLQAIFPSQSDTSRYRLAVMDRDGSNRRVLFPAQDVPGLEPQTPVWAPEPVTGQEGDFIAVVYQGNLWLVDSGNGQAYQITGDGLINRLAWK
jgi:hypothetical protein